MSRRHPHRTLTAVFAVVSLLVGGAVMVDTALADQGAVAEASTWQLQAEADLLTRHNAHRQAHGLEPLVRDPLLDAVARDWTHRMASSEVLSHRTDLREQVEQSVTQQWRRIGENVGWGPSSHWLHNAFVDSSGHNANILGDYNRIGIGATLDDDGDLWVTVNFLNGPEIAPPPDLPDAPAVDGWVVDENGIVASLGAAPHLGDLSGTTPKSPIVGLAPTPTGNGYWLVATDGGIFAFGDATYRGSTGNIRLNQPIVGMAPTPTGNGYWLVATDGGIFAFGDAPYEGSPPEMGVPLTAVAVAATSTEIAPSSTASRYWLFDTSGRALAYGTGTDGLAGTASLPGIAVAGAVR